MCFHANKYIAMEYIFMGFLSCVQFFGWLINVLMFHTLIYGESI
jgi:hypothetical protein